MSRPWKEGNRLYNQSLKIYATVTDIDGIGIVQIKTDGNFVGTGTQAAFESQRWQLVDTPH